MPFKAKAACRRHIPKQRHRVTNWAAYDAGLRARGSLTVWFTPEAVAAWAAAPRANAVPSEAAESAPAQRDRHLRCLAERGRMGWQRVSGYNWRALVEADISRWKRVIGDGLRFQTDGRQATEVMVWTTC